MSSPLWYMSDEEFSSESEEEESDDYNSDDNMNSFVMNFLNFRKFLSRFNRDEDERSTKMSKGELNNLKRCATIVSKLKEDRKEKVLCDVTIVIEGKTFPVHKALLKASSSYFSAMFTGQFAEKHKQQIEIHGVSPDTFSVLLDYMYGTSVSLTHENLRNIYLAADMLCIDSLISICKELIQDTWSESPNISTVYELAELMQLSDVTNQIIHQARVYWKGFIMNRDFTELPHTFWCAVLESRNSTMEMRDESMVHDMLKWVMHKPEERLPDFAHKIFSMIRFEFVSPKALEELLLFVDLHKNTGNEILLLSFREYLTSLYNKAHERLRGLNLKLVLTLNADVYIFFPALEKWVALPQVPKKAVSYMLTNANLYAFSNEGCTKVSLRTEDTVTLPNFPVKRKGSSFAVINRTVYAIGGVEESTAKPLQNVLALKPNSDHWHHGRTWQESRSNASSIAHKHCIYLVAGRSHYHERPTHSDCFVYNAMSRSFKKICTLPYTYKGRPCLAVYNDILYVFSGESSRVGRINLQHQQLLPSCAVAGLRYYSVLGAYSLPEGIIIAFIFDHKIFIGLYKPAAETDIEYLGCLTNPISSTDQSLLTKSTILFSFDK